MSKIIYAVAAVLAMTSCANSFNIEGTSSLSNLDGQKLYLKVFADTAFRDVDSCDVIHGQFRFSGTIDSTQVANIFLDGTPALPVVLESGNITIKIDNMQQSVTGTPLNEELSAFATKYQQLVSASADLVHKHDQAIMDGKDMAAVTRDLQAEDAEISAKLDKLVTTFIEDNMDNVLGPWVFMTTCTTRYQYPMLDAWIEDIMSKATEHFKSDPYVKDYYQKAQENQAIMNGTHEAQMDPSMQAGQMEVPQTDPNAAPAPTPNELAKPSIPEAKE